MRPVGHTASNRCGAKVGRDRAKRTWSCREPCLAGGNATGINFFVQELVAKRLRLHDLVPKAVRVVVLVNPTNASSAETTLREVEQAAATIGLQIQILKASTIGEIDAAFATLAREHPDALFVAPDAFFAGRRVQFATLTARDSIPATYAESECVAVGGLMSYGTDFADSFVKSASNQPHPQGCEASRPAGAAIDQIRVRHQPSNGASARHRGAASGARHRRPGDRVNLASHTLVCCICSRPLVARTRSCANARR